MNTNKQNKTMIFYSVRATFLLLIVVIATKTLNKNKVTLTRDEMQSAKQNYDLNSLQRDIFMLLIILRTIYMQRGNV